MAVIGTDQIEPKFWEGSCEKSALLALKNVFAGDTADIGGHFRVIKRAGIVCDAKVPQRLRRFSDVQPELYVMSKSGRGSVPQVLCTVPDDRRRVIESVIKTQRYPSLFKVALFNEIVERLT